MAEEKKKLEGKKYDERELGKIVDEAHRTMADKMAGRPYLLVVASGFEKDTHDDKTTFAAQWAWRSNVYHNREEGPKLMEFLSGQLKDAVEDKEIGIKKIYKLEK